MEHINITFDWLEIVSQHPKHLHFNKTQFGKKWCHNLLATNKNENRVDPKHLSLCLSRGHNMETWWHLLACRNPNSLDAWNLIQQELITIFQTHHINPRLQQAIYMIITLLLPNPLIRMISIPYIKACIIIAKIILTTSPVLWYVYQRLV